MNSRNHPTATRRTRRWRNALALGAFFALGLGANAQVSAYSFAQSSGTYTEITGGTVIATATANSGAPALDDVNYAVNFAPYSFTFNGTAYTSLNLNTNGYITFGATLPAAGSPYTPISNTVAYQGAVAAWGGDIIGFFNLGGLTSELRWEVVGVSPNQELVLQWKDFRPNFSTSVTAVYRINFQIRLKENGDVEVVYGPSGVVLGSPTASGTRQIGLRGATNADFINRTNTTSVNFNASTAGGANTASQAFNIAANPPGMPNNGLTYTWSPPVPCTGIPNPGSVPSPVAVCGGNTAVLTATGLTTGPGISYQWEESPDGLTGWAPVVGGSGATTPTYTTTAVNVTRYFRIVTTCSTGPDSNNSNVVTVNPINPTYLVFDGVGHSEGFENWSNLCSTTDVPTTNWKNTPETGNNSWRRNDQGASGGWTSITSGAYSPTSSEGSFSARFHTWSASSGTKGNLDLYIDMTAGSGNNGLTFDYINTSGTDSVTILQSTDGGVTFAQLGARLTTAATWTPVSRTITSTSATTVIRLRAHSDFGLTDIGIDNLQITSPCTGVPAPGNTVASVGAACPGAPFTLSLQNPTPGSGVSYQWFVSTVSGGGPWTPVGPNAPTYVTSQSQQSWYYCQVTCSTGPDSGDSNPVQVNMDVPTNCYCIPTYTTGKTAGDLISNVVIVGTTLANNTGTAPVNPAYTYFNSLPNHTASLQAGTSYQIQVTVGTFGGQHVAVWIDFNENGVFETPSERVGFTTTAIAANGTGTFTLSLPCNPTPGLKRMRVRDVWNVTGSSIDPCANYGWGETEDYDVTILPPPACPTPSGLVASSPTFNSVTLNWNVGCTETAWEIEYGTSGFALGTGTVVPAATNVNFVLGGLASATTYDVYVRADCGIDGLSGSLGPVSFTTLTPPPANDLCVNAIPVACNGTVSGNTTTATNSDAPPTCVTTLNTAPGVWYTVTGVAGPMTATTCSQVGFDTKLGVFSGSCGSLVCVTGNDDDGTCTFSSLRSRATWTAVANTTYYIYVTGFGNATGPFELTISTGDNDGDGFNNCEDDCPNLFGQIGDACNDGNPNTYLDTIDGNCNCVGIPCTDNVTLEFVTGSTPSDLSWQIVDVLSNTAFITGNGGFLPQQATIQQVYCLPGNRCYILIVTDAGDGADGYQLRYTATQARIIDNTDNLGTGTSQITGNAYSFCLPMGTNEPIYTSCDKFFWRTGEYLVAAEDVDVSAVWIPNGPNNVQSANTGYEFWFFNPNGGYSFRRFRSHNQSDGFSNVGATRACHMRVNNWAVAQHIPEFNLHNVRIRARVNGVNKAWGPACRFVRNEALAQCPPTKLMDIPGNQFLSCNQFRQWNVPGSRIHARPVSGANLYEWRFRIPAENVEIIRTSTTYFLNLNWPQLVADPLQNGKTYEVDVRASKDGGTTWCGLPGDPWGDVCLLTIVAPPMQGGGQNMAMEGGNELFNLWPNPNKGEDLWISLSEVAQGVETIAVDIHDLFGKRVSAQVLATQGDHVYTVMPLPADLASGVYTVSILAGEQRFTQRLVIAR